MRKCEFPQNTSPRFQIPIDGTPEVCTVFLEGHALLTVCHFGDWHIDSLVCFVTFHVCEFCHSKIIPRERERDFKI